MGVSRINIHEVVIVGPISCGDTECLVSLAIRQYKYKPGQSLGEAFLYQESADGRVLLNMHYMASDTPNHVIMSILTVQKHRQHFHNLLLFSIILYCQCCQFCMTITIPTIDSLYY